MIGQETLLKNFVGGRWEDASAGQAIAVRNPATGDVLGEDPYAYVMGENEKRSLAALSRYQIEQGLMKTTLPMDDLFVGHV